MLLIVVYVHYRYDAYFPNQAGIYKFPCRGIEGLVVDIDKIDIMEFFPVYSRGCRDHAPGSQTDS